MSRTAERRTAEDGPLSVTLAVEAPTGCPLANSEGGAFRQSITRSDGDGPPLCTVATTDGEPGSYRRVPVGDTCPCSRFEARDCIADLEAADDGRLRYSVVLPDREALRAVIADLRDRGLRVSLERVRAGAAPGDRREGSVALTEKQRKVLALAVAAGYYERPRETTLDDLADELGVTPSAVSQRLSAIERKLARERARSIVGRDRP